MKLTRHKKNSPYINRFLQPDSIIPNPVNPQAFNRFSYVYNNPVNLIDPTGHCGRTKDVNNCLQPSSGGSEAQSDGLQRLRSCARGCKATSLSRGSNTGVSSSPCAEDDDACWMSQSGDATILDFGGYSDWEIQILQELYKNGGPNAVYGVKYILENGIHITVKSGWQSGGGSRGAWYEGDSLIILNGDLRKPDGSVVYSLQSMPNAWGLANIIHEARHIEQGPVIAFSKFGEMDAWQIGIDVAEHLGYYNLGWNTRDLAVKNAETVVDFSQAIQDHDKPYWNAFYGTPLENYICVGLCSLPDWPVGWQMAP